MRCVIDRRKAALFCLVQRFAPARFRSRFGPPCTSRPIRDSLIWRGPLGFCVVQSTLITETHPIAFDSMHSLLLPSTTPLTHHNISNVTAYHNGLSGYRPYLYIGGRLSCTLTPRLPPACRGFHHERLLIGAPRLPAGSRYFSPPCLCRLVTAIPAWKPAGKNTGRHPGRAAPASQGARPARHLPTLRNATLGAASAIPLWASMPPLHVIRSMPHPAPMTHRCN